MLAVLMWLSTTKPKRLKAVSSDHFNGKRFFNYTHTARSLWSTFRWLTTRKPTPFPRQRNLITQPKIVNKAPSGELRVTFVNHSTFLIQWEGLNILTDPIWSERASPFKWIGPKRIHPPGIALKQLPHIDIVLLSHNHYDHLDIRTLQYLSKNHKPLIITGLGIANYLKRKGITEVSELDWWEQSTLPGGWRIRYVPAEHFSTRSITDFNKSLWGGFLLSHKDETIYFAGDTAFGPHFEDIRPHYKSLRLALLPIGAYEPRWFMHKVHMSPEDALHAHTILEAKTSIGMHFGTFQLSDEGVNEPVICLRKALKKQGIDENQFRALLPGETFLAP